MENLQPTTEEHEVMRSQSRMAGKAFRTIMRLMEKDDNFKNICNRPKKSGTNKGQYGYYINNNVGEANYLLKRFNIRSVADLGCGSGDFLDLLESHYKIGFEIEPSLVKESISRYGFSVIQKDLFNLTKKDIAGHMGLFIWEPIDDIKLAKELGCHIASIIGKNHYIFYRTAGNGMFGDPVIAGDLVEIGYFYGYNIYKKS